MAISNLSEQLSKHLKSCDLCPRCCGVDRMRGELGFCQAGADLELSYIGVHHGEEPPISGTKGSGTIFAYHCTMGCVFCQNWQISQGGKNTNSGIVSDFGLSKIQNGHNINLVSPTQYAPQLFKLIEGTALPVVYNTNGYERVEILRELAGHVAIYLPDMKYSDNALALKYSKTANYVEYNQAAIAEMFTQVGLLQTDAQGIAIQGLIVRHLVLPGQVENSKHCLDFIAQLNPEITVSVMAQYAPQYKSCDYPEIDRKLSGKEYSEIVAYAEKLGLENCYIQELESQDVYVPDFTALQPFQN